MLLHCEKFKKIEVGSFSSIASHVDNGLLSCGVV